MNVRDLLSVWDETAGGELTVEQFAVHLPVEDAARLRALAEMYPRRTLEEITTDLLSAALNEVEASLPYVRGSAVIATDEEGDPIYEDVGPTPRFLTLTRKYLERYRPSGNGRH